MGWVDNELVDTKEGDLQALERILQDVGGRTARTASCTHGRSGWMHKRTAQKSMRKLAMAAVAVTHLARNMRMNKWKRFYKLSGRYGWAASPRRFLEIAPLTRQHLLTSRISISISSPSMLLFLFLPLSVSCVVAYIMLIIFILTTTCHILINALTRWGKNYDLCRKISNRFIEFYKPQHIYKDQQKPSSSSSHISIFP